MWRSIEGVRRSHVIGLATLLNAIWMSSRNDHRRRERSWERSDRDRDRDRHRDRDRGGDRDRDRGDRYRDTRRRSRSRSPRRGEGDRRSGAYGFFPFPSEKFTGIERDRRDFRYDDRRDPDRRERDDRRRDDRREERDRHREDTRDRNVPTDREVKPSPGPKGESSGKCGTLTPSEVLTFYEAPLVQEPRAQSAGFENGQEEGESMDAVNQDDEAMMATMGIIGFGSTKVWVSSASTYKYLEIFHRGSTSKETKRVPQKSRKSELGGST